MNATDAASGNPGTTERAGGETPRQSCLVYRVSNLGDMIQTLALTRLLPPMTGVFRHDLGSAPTDRTFVVNGFLERDTPPRAGAPCLFAGVSGPHMRRARYLEWLRRSPWPVGARDPATVRRLAAAGLATELVGCATLTLPRHQGPRSGVYSVDCDGPGTRLTHRISREEPVAQQWDRATDLLAMYRTAEAVHTSRLHVALPCLAFGTPVWIARPDSAPLPDRFSLVEELGVPYETLVVHDVTPAADRYRQFLRTHLDGVVGSGEPVRPTLVTPDRLRWPDATRFRFDDLRIALRARWQSLARAR